MKGKWACGLQPKKGRTKTKEWAEVPGVQQCKA